MHKPESWNKLARKSRWAYMAIFEIWHKLTSNALNEVDAQPVGGLVRLVVTARWKSPQRHDLDNILLKPILDAVVKKGILADDSVKQITEIVLRGFEKQEEDSLQVDIIPLEIGSDGLLVS